MPRLLRVVLAIAVVIPVTQIAGIQIANADCVIVKDTKGVPQRVCTSDIPVVYPAQLGSTKRSSCGPWQVAPFLNPEATPPEGAVVGPDYVVTRVAGDGITETMYFRFCDGVITRGWLRPFTPRDLANNALRDMKAGGFPAPTASFAPPLTAMIVNFETWFGVQEVSVAPVRSQVGDVWSEATATPVGIRLNTGAIRGDDPRTIDCKPWGSIEFAADGCTWTPRYPSVPKVTGTDDLRLHGSISIIWDVTWTSSTGAGGSLGQVMSTTPIEITVMEIQVY